MCAGCAAGLVPLDLSLESCHLGRSLDSGCCILVWVAARDWGLGQDLKAYYGWLSEEERWASEEADQLDDDEVATLPHT